MNRPYNFSPGPSMLPQAVLEQAAHEMLDYNGTGMNVMEMSHRGPVFMQIQAQAMQDFRLLAGIPDDYAILFMQGGAKAENAIVPLNLMARLGTQPHQLKADYVNTGIWSTASLSEARKYGDVHVAATNEAPQTIDGVSHPSLTYVPTFEQWRVRPDTAYLHICGNETISGVEYFDWPDMAALGAPNVPVVNDVSSHILSRPIPVEQFGLLYGGAQKNIGMSGLTFVIVRKDLIGHALPICPSAFDYAQVHKNDSMYNTPSTYAIYIAGLVFQWLLKQGGVAAMERQNIAKAQLLYDFLDSSTLYKSSIAKANRSRMNVTFFLQDESLNESFLTQSKAAGLMQLKGHKSVGGMRASIYNAMPLPGVQALVAFMREFERTH